MFFLAFYIINCYNNFNYGILCENVPKRKESAMKRRIQFTAFFLAILTLFFALCSCVSTETQTPDESTSDINDGNQNTPEPSPVVYLNPLTGLSCPENEVFLRPVAIMIDNEVNYKSGQYSNLGLSSADVLFETNIESNGSGTRMMAVFSQNTLKNNDLEIGAVRSARPYFIQLAKMLDAYYVHEGSSSTDDVLPGSVTDPKYYARPMLYSDYIDGYELTFDGKISYRPKSDINNKLCVVSSAVITHAPDLLQYLTTNYPRTTYQTSEANRLFLFGDANLSAGKDASSVRIRFSDSNAFYTQSKFTYNTETGKYVRSQYLYQSSLRGVNEHDIASKDIKTGENLTFTNVFVLSTKQYACDKSYDGQPYHTKIDLIGNEGKGYYFTEGKYVNITWKCPSDSSPIRFYAENGSELVVNPGKTFINLVSDNAFPDLKIA